MADIRIKDLPTTASLTSSDDFIAIDGFTNGTRKLSAATPAFLTSVTTPSLTAPASIDLTLAGGSSGASLVLGQGASGGVTTLRDMSVGTATLNIGASGGTVRAFNVMAPTGGYATIQAGSDVTADTSLLGGFGWFSTGSSTKTAAAINVILNGSAAGVRPAAHMQIYTESGSGLSERVRLTSTGNLLIGTTSDAASLAGGLVINGSGAGAAASSTTTGALRVTGGVGVSGAGYFGGGISSGLTTQTGLIGAAKSGTSPNSGGANSFFWASTSASSAGDGIGIGDSGSGAYKWIQTYGGKLTVNQAGNNIDLGAAGSVVNILGTTAGASNAGALVVAGGISAGNTGSAASYMGGGLTFAAATTSAGGITFGTDLNLFRSAAGVLRVSSTSNYSTEITNSGGGGAASVSFNNTGGALVVGSDNSGGSALGGGTAYAGVIATATSVPLIFRTNSTTALTISTSQAATFAGAVTTGGSVLVTGASKNIRIRDTGITDANYDTLLFQAYDQNVFSIGVGALAGTPSQIRINGATNAVAFTGAVSGITTLAWTGGTTATSTGNHVFGTTNTVVMSAGTLTTTGAATFGGAVSVSGTAATWTSGTGSPESAKTAPVGSLYTRTDGGASTTLYVKESGAGNTGWIAK